MDWTPEQQRAIDIDGTNVIVSAGAGSGKTAVLTERIFERIKKGTKLDELLVLTFTNAAAHEMKERTKKRLFANLSTRHLVSEVDASYITTFDSYAYSLVRKYHYYLNLPSDVSIIDESLIRSQKYFYLEQIFNELYEKEDSAFYNLIRHYALKDDQELKDFILKIDSLSDLKIDKDAYLANYVQNHFQESKNHKDYLKIFEYQKAIFQIAFEQFGTLFSAKDALACQEALRPLLAAKSGDEFNSLVRGLKFPNAPRGKEISEEDKAQRKEIKNVCLKTAALSIPLSEAEVIANYQQTLPYVETLLSLVRELNKRLEKFKNEKGVFTFVDIAKMALRLLDNQDIVKEIINKIKYIMVDEYQDTSDIQEAFIQKIANNNLYMVGDVKQSIYRFRNANSEIFTNKYNLYANNNGGLKIDLNTNFRSREEVINNINKLFTAIMSEKQGGANYARDHLILHGNKLYNEHCNGEGYDQEVFLYCKDDLEESDLTKNEYEAALIAEDIVKKINQGYQVFDKEHKVLRKATFADFAILLATKSHFEAYKAIFDKYHIPLKAEKDLEIASSQVIMVFKNLLKLVNCLINRQTDGEFKHAYISVARSFLFEYSDQEIYDIVTTNNYHATSVVTTLADIVSEANTLSLAALMEKILFAVDFDYKLIKVGNVMANKHQVEYLYQNAQSFAKLGYSLEQFLDYFEAIEKYQIDLNVPNQINQEDTVVLMSIHKSKGLEFPIVYFAGMTGRFNDSEKKSRFIMSSEFGVLLPAPAGQNPQNFYRILHELLENRLEISERVRLLYVALTRAKEKIIIINQEKEKMVIKDFSLITSLSDFLALSPYLSTFAKGKKVSHDCKLLSTYVKEEISKEFSLKTINIPRVIKEERRASKSLGENVDESSLDFGTHIHYLLELTDFVSKDTSFISEPKERLIIDNFLKLSFFEKLESPIFLKEYAFIKDGRKGIIDLLIIAGKEIKIVDYKMKKIDDEAYVQQLAYYREVVEDLFPHHLVSCYLVSVLTNQIRQVS